MPVAPVVPAHAVAGVMTVPRAVAGQGWPDVLRDEAYDAILDQADNPLP